MEDLLMEDQLSGYEYSGIDNSIFADDSFIGVVPFESSFLDPMITIGEDGSLVIFDPTNSCTTVMSPDEVNAIIDDVMLPDDMMYASAQSARHFFGLPDAVMVGSDDQTCLYPMMTESFFDDVVGFNKEQLIGMGINTQEAVDLVMTHEAAHAVFQKDWQFEGVNNGAWEEELACDFFAGTRAGIEGMNIDGFSNAMRNTIGGDTHPTGNLRADFIESGKEFAETFKDENNREPSFNECIEYLNTHFNTREFDILAARNTLIAFGIYA